MERRRMIAPLALAAAAIAFAPTHSSAMTAQEFFAAESKGEFGSPQAQRRARQQPLQQMQTPSQRARIPVPAQTQRVSVTRSNPLAGVNLGGSWLASNLGSTRPAGAPGAWCGYAMRMEMVSMGHGDPGAEFNLVSRWCSLGTPAPVGAIGSIFVSRGHVSKVVAGDCPPGRVATISGNATARRVSHMCEPISRAVCSRWPGKV